MFETELRKAKIPTRWSGSQLFDRMEVRDLLSHPRIVDNPNDEISLLRVINTLPRHWCQDDRKSAGEAVRQGKPMWQMLDQPSMLAGLPTAAQQGIARLQGLCRQLGQSSENPNEPLAEIMRRLVNDIDYLGFLDRTYPNAEEASGQKELG